MKKVVYILVGCFFILGVSKGTTADIDDVICNAMKGMQVQEGKKIPYNIGDYRLMGISVDCKKKALITEKKHLELASSEFADDFKTESMRNWKNANCKNMIFNTDTGWSTTQIINDLHENLVLKLEANFRICSQ